MIKEIVIFIVGLVLGIFISWLVYWFFVKRKYEGVAEELKKMESLLNDTPIDGVTKGEEK